MEIVIRPARPSDDAATEHIETAADAILIERFGAIDWPPPTSPRERASMPGFVLVAESPNDATDDATDDGTAASTLVGFVHVLELDGNAHLEQLSVLPEFGRRGIGRRLVEAAMTEARGRGCSRMTLRTYVDVPWNAPFYRSCGFVASAPDTPLLRSLVQVETDLGLLVHGARTQMTAEL